LTSASRINLCGGVPRDGGQLGRGSAWVGPPGRHGNWPPPKAIGVDVAGSRRDDVWSRSCRLLSECLPAQFHPTHRHRSGGPAGPRGRRWATGSGKTTLPFDVHPGRQSIQGPHERFRCRPKAWSNGPSSEQARRFPDVVGPRHFPSRISGARFHGQEVNDQAGYRGVGSADRVQQQAQSICRADRCRRNGGAPSSRAVGESAGEPALVRGRTGRREWCTEARLIVCPQQGACKPRRTTRTSAASGI